MSNLRRRAALSVVNCSPCHPLENSIVYLLSASWSAAAEQTLASHITAPQSIFLGKPALDVFCPSVSFHMTVLPACSSSSLKDCSIVTLAVALAVLLYQNWGVESRSRSSRRTMRSSTALTKSVTLSDTDQVWNTGHVSRVTHQNYNKH